MKDALASRNIDTISTSRLEALTESQFAANEMKQINKKKEIEDLYFLKNDNAVLIRDSPFVKYYDNLLATKRDEINKENSIQRN